METYILRTSAGATVMKFDSRQRAEEERAARQRHFSRPLEIWRETRAMEQVK
jgi:hypothetical protein